MPIVNFDLNTYRTRFGGGARQYLFYAFIQFPRGNSTNYNLGSTTDGWQKWLFPAAKNVLTVYGLGAAFDRWPYLVKSTSIPESTLDEIVIPWQHLDHKMAGQVRFGDWPVTFYVDDQYAILSRLKEWQAMGHGFGDPSFTDTMTHYGISEYKQTQEIHLLNYSGDVIMSCKLVDAWPKIIGNVSYDYSSSEIATVDVTFAYTYQQFISLPSSEVSDILKRGYEKVIGYTR